MAVLDINRAGAEETASACGGDAVAIVDDLTRDGAPDDAIRGVVDRWGGIDILVNNAGYGAIEPFLEMTAALWQKTLARERHRAGARLRRRWSRHDARSAPDASSTSPRPPRAWRCPTTPPMRRARRPSTLITRAAAVALAPFGVLVNSIAPGMMDTEMQRLTEAKLAEIEGRNDLQAFLDERTRRVPLGRRVEPAEVACGVVWLALDAPDYITAERLNLSGGLDKD